MLESRDTRLDSCSTVEVKQFHNCNAFERYCYDAHGRLERVEFVSYCTPIAVLVPNWRVVDSVLYVSNACTCSAATRKQFSRWLREHCNEVNTSYISVKHELERACKTHPTHCAIALDGKGELLRSFSGSELDKLHMFFSCLYESAKPFQNYR